MALALSAAVVGAVATTSTQAVQLAQDGLGDAAIFQYYTAQANWQTFFRVVNTDDDSGVAVKFRFREAANSREVLDFVVFLSPGDVWTAWTGANVNGNGPGIKTNDTSCLYPAPGQSGNEGFVSLGGDVVGANFKSRAFSDDGAFQNYSDNGAKSIPERLGEGHLEVIGVAEWDIRGSSADRDMVQNMSHSGAYPASCDNAIALFEQPGSSSGGDVENQLAFNAYLVNVGSGQGGGYDPAVLANFTNQRLDFAANSTDQQPDMDNAQPFSQILDDDGQFYQTSFNDPLTNGSYHQARADGTAPLGPVTQYSADLNNDGSVSGTVDIDLNQNGSIQGFETINEANISTNQAAFLTGKTLSARNPVLVGDLKFDQSGVNNTWPVALSVVARGPAVPRQKWSGVLGAQTVTGGVDAVSSLFMRTEVINEWAASNNPAATINDYFTQWVLTFPTKHYYVDLATDTNLADDVSPTLVDPNVLTNDAIAPFSWEFDDAVPTAVANPAGMSCEPYVLDVYNREERFVRYPSPAPAGVDQLCYETNVVNWNERYATSGLNSKFAVTVNELNLPYDANGDRSERGWARMTFSGNAATNIGLTGLDAGLNRAEENTFYGLPVDGFMLSIYNTQSSANNHTTINEHKYDRDIEQNF